MWRKVFYELAVNELMKEKYPDDAGARCDMVRVCTFTDQFQAHAIIKKTTKHWHVIFHHGTNMSWQIDQVVLK
jgi:hypothetical protein